MPPDQPASSTPPVEETCFPASEQGSSANDLLLGCPCGQRLKVPRSTAGRQARCPACSRLLQVPATMTPGAPSTQDVGATFATQNKRAIEETLTQDKPPGP